MPSTAKMGDFLKKLADVIMFRKNGLFNPDSYSFLNTYLKKVENGKPTKKSAFTLNGSPQLKDSVCKDTLNVANFVQSEDGLWFINEKSEKVKKTSDKLFRI